MSERPFQPYKDRRGDNSPTSLESSGLESRVNKIQRSLAHCKKKAGFALEQLLLERII